MSDSESTQSECGNPEYITWKNIKIGRTNLKINEDKICIFNNKCKNKSCPYIHLSFDEVEDLKHYILNDLKDDLGFQINPNVYIPVQVFNDLKKYREKNSKSKISNSTRSNSCSVPDHSTSSASGIFTRTCVDSSSKNGKESEEFIEILNIMMRLKNDRHGWASLKDWLSNYIQEEYSPESKMMEHLSNLLKISEK